MSRVLVALAAPALLLAAVQPLAAQTVERHALSGEHVTIFNLAGRAVIEPSDGREVIVEVARGGMDGRELTIEASAGRLVVRYPDRDIVYRDRGGWRGETRIRVESDGTFARSGGDWGSHSVRIRSTGGGVEAHADLRISVPRGQRLTLNLGVGEIEATHVDGEIELRTQASSITARAMKGRLTARTGSGRVSIDDADVTALQASTGSGAVELLGVKAQELRASTGSGTISGRNLAADRVDASTGSGGLRLEGIATDDLRASTGSGGVRLELTRTPRNATVRAGSGSIALALPDGANAEVDISTGSGGISTEFPVTMEEVRRRQLRGRIGTGADGRLRVSTGSGSVRLVKR